MTHPSPNELVKQFHATYNLPVHVGKPRVDFDRIHMRYNLIAEEFVELTEALYGEIAANAVEEGIHYFPRSEGGDVVEAADALADLVYVIYGLALEAGIPLDDVLQEVQRSNLSKLGPDGLPIYRTDGKVLKGDAYFPPDIAGVLERNT